MNKRNFLIFVVVTFFWVFGSFAQNGNREGLNPSTTSIVNSFVIGTTCGATISNLTVAISTPIVSGATTYTFRLTNLVSGAVQIITRPVNSFSMSNYPATIAYNTPFNVEVSVNGGITYGPPCLLHTPLPICNIGAQCSTTLGSMTQWVYCTYVTGVIGYRFRITNTTTNAVQIFDSPSNRFYFNQLTNRSFGTTYLVEVAVKNSDGSYLPFNTGCTINTPNFPITTIQNSQCKSTVTNFKQNIYAIVVTGASDYRFLVSRAGFPAYSATVERPLNYFCFNMLPGLQSGTTYSVKVAVKVGGEWSPFGTACYITTSGVAARVSQIDDAFKVIAYPNPFTENYKLNITTTDAAAIQIKVYDMFGKQVENSNVEVSDFENLQIGANYESGVYHVVVSQGENHQNLRVIKR